MSSLESEKFYEGEIYSPVGRALPGSGFEVRSLSEADEVLDQKGFLQGMADFFRGKISTVMLGGALLMNSGCKGDEEQLSNGSRDRIEKVDPKLIAEHGESVKNLDPEFELANLPKSYLNLTFGKLSKFQPYLDALDRAGADCENRKVLKFVVDELRKSDLPVELAAILFVEEPNMNAKSLSGGCAEGIAQFLKGTGNDRGLKMQGHFYQKMRSGRRCKRYLYDERRDKMLAAGAFVRHLVFIRDFFKKAGLRFSLPLIVTAYNFGQSGLLRKLGSGKNLDKTQFEDLFAKLRVLKNQEHYNYYSRFLLYVLSGFAAKIQSISSCSTQQLSVAYVYEPTSNEVYEVRRGDNFYKIARKFGVSVYDLKLANGGIDPRRLRIGAQIVIPKTFNLQKLLIETGMTRKGFEKLNPAFLGKGPLFAGARLYLSASVSGKVETCYDSLKKVDQ
jgi:LysM repeat protein